jgi:hypothetical protein
MFPVYLIIVSKLLAISILPICTGSNFDRYRWQSIRNLMSLASSATCVSSSYSIDDPHLSCIVCEFSFSSFHCSEADRKKVKLLDGVADRMLRDVLLVCNTSFACISNFCEVISVFQLKITAESRVGRG